LPIIKDIYEFYANAMCILYTSLSFPEKKVWHF
jgi:hypothetical protein